MAGTAVTFLSVTMAHVILRLRVAREIIGFLSVTDTYIQTISEMRRRISACTLRFDIILLYPSGIGCRSFAHVAMRLSFVTDGASFSS